MSLKSNYCRFIGWNAKDMSRERADELLEAVADELKVFGEASYSCFEDSACNYLGFGVDIQYFSGNDGLKLVNYEEEWRPSKDEVMEMLFDLDLTEEEKDAIATYQYVALV